MSPVQPIGMIQCIRRARLRSPVLRAAAGLLTITLLFLPESSTVALEGDACKAEMSAFCPGLTGKMRIAQCLLEKESSLSPDCRKELDGIRESMRAAASSACRNDVSMHCPWVIPGGGRIIRCLFEHASGLSPACKTFLEQ